MCCSLLLATFRVTSSGFFKKIPPCSSFYEKSMAGDADAFLGLTLNGQFEVLEHINDGFFSHVFRGVDQHSGETVAIKMLSPLRVLQDASCAIEFDTEARLLDILSNASNVVDSKGTFTDTVAVELPPGTGNVLHLTVRYHALECADCALDEVVVNRALFDWPTRLQLFRLAVAGVHQMHIARVVHRDLKSSNALLFDTAKQTSTLKLSDFGRSRALKEAASLPPLAYVAGRGDQSFAPPELFWLLGVDDDVSFRRADIYLLGSLLFELATGQGMTGIAIPDRQARFMAALSMQESERLRSFRATVGVLRASYKLALDVLAAELPPSIRLDVVDLVRQMCDPDPAAREHRFRAERRTQTWGLEWVFRRVDIISRCLRKPLAHAQKGKKVS
jgi:serine/threonine protein kinase